MGFEVDFLPVGHSNGDAICIRYGNPLTGYTIHVVDGGYTDTAKEIISHIENLYGGATRIDHMVLSHADHDHAAGLIGVLDHFDVGTLWMNRPWLYARDTIHNFHGNYTEQGLREEIRRLNPHLVELERIALSRRIPIMDAFAGTVIGQFVVLAPTKERYLRILPDFGRTPQSYAEAEKSMLDRLYDTAKQVARWFETWTTERLSENPPAVSASNESSVVQFGDLDGSKILLSADAGPDALNEAADVAGRLGLYGPINLVQIPHHGSRRNVTPSVLNRILGAPVAEGVERGMAFCSVGQGKPEYPRNRVKNAFLRRGYTVASTRSIWISYFKNMPVRGNAVPLKFEAFSHEYEE
jgi:beta-lactamase superfamily II metal-dependent hydrolase